jgi:large subunit ribosomal protein L13
MGSYTASTTFVRPNDVKRDWWIVDAADSESIGRLAARVAIILRGKHKANFTPHINCGDHIVIINADKVRITGKKRDQKVFYWHTGHPGGIKERTWDETLRSKHPERLLKKAIVRMMPKESPLATEQFRKLLHVYTGNEHPHSAQNPQQFKFFK